MNINIKNNVIEIEGVIKKIEDAEKIIQSINTINENMIHLKIIDSYVLPSSIIGHLLRINEEGKNIKIGVKSDLLYELLTDLNLNKKFSLYKL